MNTPENIGLLVVFHVVAHHHVPPPARCTTKLCQRKLSRFCGEISATPAYDTSLRQRPVLSASMSHLVLRKDSIGAAATRDGPLAYVRKECKSWHWSSQFKSLESASPS